MINGFFLWVQKGYKYYFYMTINILDSDWTKHYFTLHFKIWWSPLKSAREVNITFEHCSVYPKIVAGNVQVTYFEMYSLIGLKSSFQMISKLSLLHNCINEESYEIVNSRSRGYNSLGEGNVGLSIGAFGGSKTTWQKNTKEIVQIKILLQN